MHNLHVVSGIKKDYVPFMSRPRFALTSEQLELLLAFDESNGLSALAEKMAKDPSVISRGLQKMAEEQPVIEKIKGRWELTELGKKIIVLTKSFLIEQQRLLVPKAKVPENSHAIHNSLLIIINAQVGLLEASETNRNNSEAEENIKKLLAKWRELKRPVIHVKHVSENKDSLFYKNSLNCEILPQLMPLDTEVIVEKSKSSSFAETNLESHLKTFEPSSLVLVGFTANDCIEATARDAAALGFSTQVVSDATAMFDMRGPNGKLMKADRLHKLTMANLNAFYAKVLSTSELI